MLFNSFNFLVFFPVVTLLYFLLPQKFRWGLLLIASCFFYMFFIPEYILILAVTILIDYLAAIFIVRSEGKKKKYYLIASIVSTCLVLIIFKYFNFFNANFKSIAALFHLNYPVEFINIILPIGLSFHTFQSLSYVIEVYRGNQVPEKHFGIYSLYVMFYPQLVAGPIERPQNLLHQFYEKHYFDAGRVSQGLKLMLWGLFKKVVIADRLAIYVNAVYNNSDHHSGLSLGLATIFFAFQIYCDFSGYSDIARGAAKVMGFELMVNFRRPYFARSIAEFWKRWHISLSTWFRDYLYISLGGNRVSAWRRYFNLFITFLVSGFWHGANWTFVIWGGLNGLYLIMEIWFKDIKESLNSLRYFKTVTNYILPILVTFVLSCFAWIFFRAGSLEQSLQIIQKILTFEGPLFIDFPTMVYSFLGLAILLAVELEEEYGILDLSLMNNKNLAIRFSTYAFIVISILAMGVLDGGQFIYFQF